MALGKSACSWIIHSAWLHVFEKTFEAMAAHCLQVPCCMRVAASRARRGPEAFSSSKLLTASAIFNLLLAGLLIYTFSSQTGLPWAPWLEHDCQNNGIGLLCSRLTDLWSQKWGRRGLRVLTCQVSACQVWDACISLFAFWATSMSQGAQDAVKRQEFLGDPESLDMTLLWNNMCSIIMLLPFFNPACW